ncbi:MAG TPA: hypothetical protein VF503_21315 [Sphingobium sp.]|uniref:hypothetical protein n=1 Tax=Sphingobium sp. TaxID=1912891 RepID=UPI002ED4C6A8
MAYAEGTKVSVEKSVGEIVSLIKKNGATRIAQAEDVDHLAVQFWLKDRMLRFRIGLPTLEQMPTHDGRRVALSRQQRNDRAAAACRQRARALLLVIKAKFESIESNIETFDEAFLPNIVMADGLTVWERVSDNMALEYQSGKPIPMLLEGPKS